MSYKICFISPYPKLTSRLYSHFAESQSPPHIFEDSVMDGAESTLRKIEKIGCEVIVTTAFHSRKLRSTCSVPVVHIPMSTFDIAVAVNEAKRLFGGPVAMFEPHESSPRLDAISAMLECPVKAYVFVGPEDASEKIRQARQDGCVCGVGGGINEGIARDIGFNFVTLLPGPEMIEQAYQQARQISAVQRKERYEAMKFKYTVQFASSGIVVTDHHNIITVFNPAAERMLMLSGSEVLGKKAGDIMPNGLICPSKSRAVPRLAEIKAFGKNQLMVNTIPIHDRKRFVGTIITFQELSHIRSLEEKIRRAAHQKSLHAKLTFDDIIAKSPAAIKIVKRARHYAKSDETVLITGETGTGKEIFAQSLHNASPRRDHPFVAVSCATIPANLLESELFGYAEGAFTGALRGGKQGLFELAHGGTIFLDEIGEISLETQVLLLRVLQEKEIMRIGDAKIIPVDVRIITATNRQLDEAIKQDRFRLDLYHRLNILHMEIPPLSQRKEDILPLTRTILYRICPDRSLTKKIYSLLMHHKEALQSHTWPGNVRELENLLRRMVASLEIMGPKEFMAEAKILLQEALTVSSDSRVASGHAEALPGGNLNEMTTLFEQVVLSEKLNQLSGNKSQLAKELGISRTTLWRKMKR